MFKTVGRHVPPPPGIKPPPLWGTEERVRELFGEGVSSLTTTRRTYVFRYLSAEHLIGPSAPTTALCTRRSSRSTRPARTPSRRTSRS
jgi:hypothetical protein